MGAKKSKLRVNQPRLPDDDEILRLIGQGIGADVKEVSRQIYLSVDWRHVSVVPQLLGFCKDLLLHDDTDASSCGYAIIQRLMHYNEIPSSLRLELFLEVTQVSTSALYPCHYLALLAVLSKNGRDIDCFCPMLPQIFSYLVEGRSTSEQQRLVNDQVSHAADVEIPSPLNLVLNVVKFNAAMVQDQHIRGLTQQIYNNRFSIRVQEAGEVSALVGTIIAYSSVPNDVLPHLVTILCTLWGEHQHDSDAVTEQLWKTFTWLLSTHQRTFAIEQILTILEQDTEAHVPPHAVGAYCMLLKALSDLPTRPHVDSEPFLSRLILALGAPSGDIKWRLYRLDFLEFLFKDEDVRRRLSEEQDWSMVQTAIVSNATLAITPQPSHGTSLDNNNEWDRLVPTDLSKETDSNGVRQEVNFNALIMEQIQCIIDLIFDLPSTLLQKRTLRGIGLSIAPLLTIAQARKLIDSYEPSAYRISIGRWLEEMQLLASNYIDNPEASLSLRQRALHSVNEALQQAHALGDKNAVDFCKNVMQAALQKEENYTFRGNLVHYIVQYTTTIEHTREEKEEIMRCLMTSARKECHRGVTTAAIRCWQTLDDRARSSEPEFQAAEQFLIGDQTLPSMLPDAGAVVLLMRYSDYDVTMARFIYNEILQLLDHTGTVRDPDAVVMLLRGMFRLRSDAEHHVFFLKTAEGESLARMLDRVANEDNRRSRHNSQQYEGNSDLLEKFRPEGAFRPPVWRYGQINGLPEDPPDRISKVLFSEPRHDHEANGGEACHLDMAKWLDRVLHILKNEGDHEWQSNWEIYSYVIVHLGPQLTNQSLFIGALEQIKEISEVICEQILEENGRKVLKPPERSNLRQEDVATCLINILTTIIGYHKFLSPEQSRMMVASFVRGLTGWGKTTVPCVHALTLCCYELPISLGKYLAQVVDTMSTIVTKQNAAIHVLEFMAGLSRIDELARKFHGDEIKRVFGVCFSYITYAKGKRYDERQQRAAQAITAARQGSVGTGEQASSQDGDISQYVYAISYHTISYWFLTLKPEDRKRFLPWMEQRLLSKDESGKVEDEALVTLDHLWRITEKEVQTTPELDNSSNEEVVTKSWVSQYCLLTIKVASDGSSVRVIERRPSGTDESSLPPPDSETDLTPQGIFERHWVAATMDGPFSLDKGPIPVPENDATRRAMAGIDHRSPIDYFKTGVIYIGENQSQEREILCNVSGSPDYVSFVARLGDRISLLHYRGNVAGLDTSDGLFDGPYTYQDVDNITTLNFHVTTAMPTNMTHDPNCIRKKAHIGNDYVNIIFNNSGRAFDFGTFPSQFNYVYIVVTPEARQTFIQARTRPLSYHDSWFKVQVLTQQGFPEISSASEIRVVSGAALSAYVRNLALNAEVFCRVWANKDTNEYPSSWRDRLQQIRRLRDRVETMQEQQ